MADFKKVIEEGDKKKITAQINAIAISRSQLKFNSILVEKTQVKKFFRKKEKCLVFNQFIAQLVKKSQGYTVHLLARTKYIFLDLKEPKRRVLMDKRKNSGRILDKINSLPEKTQTFSRFYPFLF